LESSKTFTSDLAASQYLAASQFFQSLRTSLALKANIPHFFAAPSDTQSINEDKSGQFFNSATTESGVNINQTDSLSLFGFPMKS
jgi:hypothetical protein